MTVISRRFVEYDYLFNKIKHNSEHLTDQQIHDMLDEMNVHFDDLTFTFEERSYGWQTKIYCNNSDTILLPDDLSKPAFDYWIRQLKDLTKKRYMSVAV